MRFNSTLISTAICLMGLFSANAQEFSVGWFTIDGGGGTTSGATYVLSGSIGQPDAGAMSGNDYALHAGFWNIVALEAGAPPVLHISHTAAGGVAISWPGPAPDFVLQESSSLGLSASWTDVGATVIVNGDENTVIQPLAAGGRFYRLRHP